MRGAEGEHRLNPSRSVFSAPCQRGKGQARLALNAWRRVPLVVRSQSAEINQPGRNAMKTGMTLATAVLTVSIRRSKRSKWAAIRSCRPRRTYREAHRQMGEERSRNWRERCRGQGGRERASFQSQLGQAHCRRMREIALPVFGRVKATPRAVRFRVRRIALESARQDGSFPMPIALKLNSPPP